jgi:2-iminobutanoate/2-iminopropanoate deaminase
MRVIVFIFCLLFALSICNAQRNNEVDAKKILFTEKAPKPIGPYSQVVIAGDYIYLSGQIALDSTGKIISGTAAEEAKQIMLNIKAIIQSAGAEMSDIVKTSIFLTDLNEFAKVNEVYGSFFGGEYPARETVQVAALPKGAKVEISVIGYKPKNKLLKRK